MLNSTFPSKTARFLFTLSLEVPPEIRLGVTAFCARHARVRMRGCGLPTRASRVLNPHARTTSARSCASLLPTGSHRRHPAGSSPRKLCKRRGIRDQQELRVFPRPPQALHKLTQLPWAWTNAGYCEFNSSAIWIQTQTQFSCCN